MESSEAKDPPLLILRVALGSKRLFIEISAGFSILVGCVVLFVWLCCHCSISLVLGLVFLYGAVG
jgi:hypothetical protein